MATLPSAERRAFALKINRWDAPRSGLAAAQPRAMERSAPAAPRCGGGVEDDARRVPGSQPAAHPETRWGPEPPGGCSGATERSGPKAELSPAGSPRSPASLPGATSPTPPRPRRPRGWQVAGPGSAKGAGLAVQGPPPSFL